MVRKVGPEELQGLELGRIRSVLALSNLALLQSLNLNHVSSL